MANKKKRPARKAAKKRTAPKRARKSARKRTASKKARKSASKAGKKSPRISPAKRSPFRKQQLQSIRKELIKEREQLLEQLTSIKGENLSKSQKDSSGDLSGYTLHMADMATDLYNREFSLELAEGERERLLNLEEALKRIDEGSYGRCDSCGGAIPKQRLKVLPQAKYCIKCQESQEKPGTK